MENMGSSAFTAANAVRRKPRTTTLRRPRLRIHLLSESHEMSPPSSAQSLRKLSPDDNEDSDSSFQRKEIYLNNPTSRSSFVGMAPQNKSKKDNKMYKELNGYYGGSSLKGGHESDLRCSSKGVLAPSRRTSTSEVRGSLDIQSSSGDLNVGKSGIGHSTHQSEGAANVRVENKLMKVKLKVGGVTRTLHAKPDCSAGNDGPSSAKAPSTLDPSRNLLKLTKKDYSDGHSPSDGGNTFCRDSSGLRYSHVTPNDSRDEEIPRMPHTEATRKSKRIPKKRVFDDGQEDEERYYFERHKTLKVAADQSGEFGEYDENAVKKRKISNIPKSQNVAYEVDEDYVSRSIKESRRRSKPGKESEDTDYFEEEEPGSDGGPEIKRNRKVKIDLPADVRTEPLTTRQRALQSGKGGDGENLIEFPNGLPPNPSKRTKDKLSEQEKQAKKAEAAQRRRMQVEKQARETEASAIRKILGHDTNKKKEEKKQKELEKAKAAESKILKPSTIRWVLGPNGTHVTFADDIGLPSIFSSKPCSYPPPREKCSGPSCANPYKYRDSKSKLPLCSLECYRAVQGNAEPLTC